MCVCGVCVCVWVCVCGCVRACVCGKCGAFQVRAVRGGVAAWVEVREQGGGARGGLSA